MKNNPEHPTEPAEREEFYHWAFYEFTHSPILELLADSDRVAELAEHMRGNGFYNVWQQVIKESDRSVRRLSVSSQNCEEPVGYMAMFEHASTCLVEWLEAQGIEELDILHAELRTMLLASGEEEDRHFLTAEYYGLLTELSQLRSATPADFAS